jgi:hypothetical protein
MRQKTQETLEGGFSAAERERIQLLLFYGHPVKDLGLKDFWDWFN